MIEPDFVAIDHKDDRRICRIELSLWHCIVCMAVFWMVVNKITLQVGRNVSRVNAVNHPRTLSYVKLVCAMSVTDFTISSFLLLGTLSHRLLFGQKQEYEGTKRCYDIGFSFAFCLLSAFAWDVVKYSALLGLTAGSISATVGLIWSCLLICLLFLYRFATQAMPIVEVCPQQDQSFVDTSLLLLVTIIAVLTILNNRHYHRFRSIINQQLCQLKEIPSQESITGITSEQSREEKGNYLQQGLSKIAVDNFTTECDKELNNPLSEITSKTSITCIILLTVLPLCLTYCLVSRVQMLPVDLKLLYFGILQLFMSFFNLLRSLNLPELQNIS